MISNTDRLIEIIEDHNSMEIALRIICDALESRELPKEGTLPIFNDELVSDMVVMILEGVTGCEYE